MSVDKQSTVSQQSKTEDSVRSPLVTEMGNTTIAENVVAKLSGIAAREVPGVYSMGTAARRAFDTLTDRIPGSQTNVSGGVSVEKGEKQTAIDLTIVVGYGTSIVDVAEAIRRNVIRAVEQGTGLQIVEVNIEVTDVHLPGDDDDQQSTGDTVELN
ncbi:Asp23/Gls24 family envelope stress response protein [Brevibacterium sp. CBA3109]|uniref:Asp23/Gls24 family envelope stress response protein n=1 Tax=Brevibacterium koreense TaxID=3140787 RepID=A0AAU7UJY4_9MICO